MRTIIFFTAFALISVASFSQDIVSLKSGAKIEVTITEITPTLIRYKLFTEPNGRVFFMYKDKVAGIRYGDGREETFDKSGDQKSESEPSQKVNENQNQQQPSKTIVYEQKSIETISQPKSADNWSQPNYLLQSYSEMNETIYLSDGSTIRGTIIEQVPNKYLKIKTADGNIITCQMDDVEKIVEGAPNINYISYHSFPALNFGYKGSIDIGYYFGIGGNKANRINLNIINGIKFNPYFSLGFGTGLHYYTFDEQFLIPIFADFRVYFIDRTISPYLSFDIGYSFNVSNDFEGEGILINPTMGVSFKISERNEIHTGVSYQMQRRKYFFSGYNQSYSSQIDMESIALKVGFSF